MKLTGYNILLISPEPWHHIFVSKHHYAIHLAARGNRVFYLDPPGQSERVEPTQHENVVCIKYKGFPPGLRFYPRRLRNALIYQKFKQLEKICEAKVDLIWSFDNSVFFDFSALPERVLSISHIVDLNQNFQFADASRTAKVCFGVSRSIVSKQKAFNPKSFFINHGYSAITSTAPVRLPVTDLKYRVGYAGNLDLMYIDWKCLRQVISERRDAAFYFAGPFSVTNAHCEWLKIQNNVFLLGRYSSEDLSSFYDQMDILLICYRSDDYTEQLENSHKMMEYLGSGRVIVSTFISEHEGLGNSNLLLMSSRNGEYPSKLDDALNDLLNWNSVEKQELRRNVALANSYHNQIDRIETILDKEVIKESFTGV